VTTQHIYKKLVYGMYESICNQQV